MLTDFLVLPTFAVISNSIHGMEGKSDEENFLVLAGELTVFYGIPGEKRSQTLLHNGRVRIPAGTAHGILNQGKENAILLTTFKVVGKPITQGFHRWFPRAAELGENFPAAIQVAIEEYDTALLEQPGGTRELRHRLHLTDGIPEWLRVELKGASF